MEVYVLTADLLVLLPAFLVECIENYVELHVDVVEVRRYQSIDQKRAH